MQGKITRLEDIENNCQTVNGGFAFQSEEVERYISVTPSERQLEHSRHPYYNFIHFGINTFYNREWGDGKEDISRFNPEKLDTDRWCEILKSTGSSGIILTAKHHDGFCLWDTKQTDHCVMNTPFKKDIVASLQKSCEKYNLKLGIYLSPWDRHDYRYGTEEYNDYYAAQLEELSTNYGEIFCFWFDGACGEGKNGKKQVYDWERYYAIIRKNQPKAVISVCGPDVRWIGNEGGKVRKSEWSVVPKRVIDCEKVMEASQQNTDEAESLAKLDNYCEDLGSRKILEQSKELVWSGAEADVSVTPGWFYHDNKYYLFKKKRTAKELVKIYFNTVGANAALLLNIPPDKNGEISQREQKTLKAFTQEIQNTFKNRIDFKEAFAVSKSGQRKLEENKFELQEKEFALRFVFEKEQNITCLVLSEDIQKSQRVESFDVYAKQGSAYKLIKSLTVIGSQRIIRLKKGVRTDEIAVVFTQSRSYPMINKAEFFA
ncbi:MAG: alpha-L-fucosidase [Acutalibacteraceae bacterium]